MNQKEKFHKEDGTKPADNATYRSLVGCLMYLIATKPDIMFAVSVISRFLNCAIKFSKSQHFNLHGFSYNDWVGLSDDMKSTSGYCFSLGSTYFSWCSRK
ncbi:hypothetical protein CRG98_006600 [Punica granatum]|uniref:Reverse transcriptase Ty1/copia-type domain-containing protein n=1 Tax=Punica granatum TaxID=22663 RepID=A0A2I0KX01_PUNGR|nr:hypothetical protein CRG98_006600 [Punica granatum]